MTGREPVLTLVLREVEPGERRPLVVPTVSLAAWERPLRLSPVLPVGGDPVAALLAGRTGWAADWPGGER